MTEPLSSDQSVGIVRFSLLFSFGWMEQDIKWESKDIQEPIEKKVDLENTITGKQLKIEKENSEELESSVVRIRLLRRSLLGTLIFVALSLFSLGLFYVLTKWFDAIWRKMCFKKTILRRSNFIELKSDGSPTNFFDLSRSLPLYSLNQMGKERLCLCGRTITMTIGCFCTDFKSLC